jgi:hypothetical protein
LVQGFTEIPVISDKDLNGIKWNDYLG